MAFARVVALHSHPHYRGQREMGHHELSKCFAAACIMAGIAVSAAAQAQDATTCGKAKGDAGIAACTRRIETRGLSLKSRAIAYDNRGSEYGGKGDYDRATADFNEAMRLDPSFFSPRYNRGLVYQIKGEYDRAIEEYNEAIRLNPKFANAYLNRGLTWEKKGALQSALADLQKYVALAPPDSNGPAAVARVTKALSEK